MMKHSAILSGILIILFPFHTVGFAADRIVPGVYPTIQCAINTAVDGDTVIVEPNTYTGAGQNACLEFRAIALPFVAFTQTTLILSPLL